MASRRIAHREAPRVLIFYDHPEEFLPELSSRFPAVNFFVCPAYDQLASALGQIKPEVVLAYKFEPQPFPRAQLVSCASLKWLSVAFAGLDPVVPWDERKLTVTNAAGVAATEMAQYALAAMLGLFQGFPGFFANQVARKWNHHIVRSARDATVGIVGLGHNGRALARMARAVGMKVVACRRSPGPSKDVAATYAIDRLHAMLGNVDVTVVCCALTPLTQDLFDESAFAAMKPGSYFINMARGAIVREEPLVSALMTGHLAGAVIDVARTEPLPSASPLWSAPNLLITPHTSSLYDGWVRDAALMFADNLDRWMKGRPLKNRASSDRGY